MPKKMKDMTVEEAYNKKYAKGTPKGAVKKIDDIVLKALGKKENDTIYTDIEKKAKRRDRRMRELMEDDPVKGNGNKKGKKKKK